MANPTYPGNSSLAPEIQQRVEGTFRQTLDLAGKGSLKEALLGCDFVLRLDPDFAPARQLADRLATATGPVDVSSFLAPAPAEREWGAEDDLDLPELPLLPEFGMDAAELKSQLTSLVGQRRFDDALRLAESEALAVQGDPELRRLAEQAQSGAEAEPYIRPFLDSARRAAIGGRAEEAEGFLRKVAALDPTHPEIEEIRRLARPAAGAVAGAPGVEPGAFSLGGLALDDEPFGPGSRDAGGGSDRRIDELMHEGQAAFDRGEYQVAIDAWSRIFLIDIDHREAAQQIEVARRLKAEREREAEEVFHDAAARFEAGDRAGARAGFERVLELAPSYFAAREYLDRLGAVTAAELGPAVGSPPPAPSRPAPGGEEEPRGRAELKQEVFVPPDPGEEMKRAAPVGSRVAVTARRGASSGSRMFVLVGGAVLVAVLVGAWFLWTSRERLFPNSTPTPTPVAAVVDPIARARALHAEGKTTLAIAQLRRLPPDSPVQAEARTLISQWESAEDGKKPPGDGPAPEILAKRDGLVSAARAAFAEGENVRAVMLFDQASALAALEAEPAALAVQARERAAPLAAEMDLFRRGEWEFMLNNLWRKREADPRNRDVQRLMVDAYYNLGVRDLQRGDANAAAEKFREALNIDARDREIQRLALFTKSYQERGEDLLFRIFVKYLPAR
ncbi:MAG: hypothetical protein IPJ17_04780 [Holophagales bacterium]|nr:MAG: hypothetical protein IPJ17_04780 [Holophagales bacterium]